MQTQILGVNLLKMLFYEIKKPLSNCERFFSLRRLEYYFWEILTPLATEVQFQLQQLRLLMFSKL